MTRLGAGPVPAGFADLSTPASRLWAAEAHRPGLAAAGLLDPGGLETAIRMPPGERAEGRGVTPIVALPGCSTRVVLRPLRRGGLLGRWLGRGILDPNRPLRELSVTASLREAGVPVPEPALSAAWRSRGPVWHALIATIAEDGAVDALAFLEQAPSAARVRRAATAAGQSLRKFHDAGGVHADLHLKNLMVRERDDRSEVIVIDLDRARRVPSVDARTRMAQLMRLRRSLVKRSLLARAGPRAEGALLHAYLQGDRTLRAAMLAWLPAERRREALHRLHY